MVLQHLFQPDLLRVRLLSKSWRALVLDDQRFFLLVCLDGTRGRYKQFIQRLEYAVSKALPIAIRIFLPHVMTRLSHEIMEGQVSPSIEKAMPLVRSLSITSGTTLSAAGLAFLLAPAPLLRDFTLRINEVYYGLFMWATGQHDDASDSDAGDDGDDASAPVVDVSTPPLSPDLFSCSASRLNQVNLRGITLPERPAAAFSRVVDVALHGLNGIPALGLGAHFPAAKALSLVITGDVFPVGGATCARVDWFPAGLSTFELYDHALLLRDFLWFADLAAVPAVRISYDSHFEFGDDDDRPTVQLNGDAADFAAREADWTAALAHLATPRRLDIFRTGGYVRDINVAVRAARDPTRVVTFYANECFSDPHSGVEYVPLSCLGSIAPTLTELSVEHARLRALFHLADALPALRSISVTLINSTPFWDAAAEAAIPRALQCPALDRLELSCDTASGGDIPSEELALFARSLGLSADHRAHLVLRGIHVQNGTQHAEFFDSK